MKHSSLIASFALLLTTATACGGAKQAQSQPDYQYQQWLEAQNQAQTAQNPVTPTASPQQGAESPYKQRPTRTLRVEEPCITMALEQTGHWRSYGTATSYVEKAAMAEAERDARNRLAQMLRVSVDGAAQDYAMNANENLNKTAETLGEEVMTQYVMADLKNTRIIKQTIYDLSDGSVQVYVCIEMDKSADEMEKKIENGLERSGVMRARNDRENFINKMQAGMDDYKARMAAEAEAEGL